MHGGGARGGFSGGGFRGGTAFRGGGGFRGGYRGIGGFRGRVGLRGFYGFPYYYGGLYGGLYDSCFWDYDFCFGYPDYGYGYSDYGYPPYQAPTEYQPSPGVVIISNQAPPPRPAIVEVPSAPSAWNAGPTTQAKRYEEPLYLLAMKDGTIRAVLAYWVDGMTVHYVTMDHEQKQTMLSSLDRSLSERLNRERNVTFQLPG